MCGPAFCAYRISQDVNKMASEGGLVALGEKSDDVPHSAEEISEGMALQAQEFRSGGSDLYVPLAEAKTRSRST